MRSLLGVDIVLAVVHLARRGDAADARWCTIVAPNVSASIGQVCYSPCHTNSDTLRFSGHKEECSQTATTTACAAAESQSRENVVCPLCKPSDPICGFEDGCVDCSTMVKMTILMFHMHQLMVDI